MAPLVSSITEADLHSATSYIPSPSAIGAVGNKLQYKGMAEATIAGWPRMVSILLWATLLSLIGHCTLMLSLMFISSVCRRIESFRQRPIQLNEYTFVPQNDEDEERLAGFCISPRSASSLVGDQKKEVFLFQDGRLVVCDAEVDNRAPEAPLIEKD